MKKRKSNPIMTAIRTAVAYPLLALQLLFVLFILEVPYWIADRFFARNRGDAFYRAQRGVARWFVRLYPFGWQRRVNVRASAFPQPCVIVCKRQSMLDTFLLMLLPVNARFFVRTDSLRFPLMGELNRLARHIRSDDGSGLDTALDWLSRGVSIIMYVEGGADAYELAAQAGVPVVPVVIEGSTDCIKPGSALVGHPDITIKVLEPTQPNAEGRREAGEGDPTKPGIPIVHGWLTRLTGLAVGLALGAAALLSIYVDNFCITEPPAYDGNRSLADAEIHESRFDDRRVQRLGENWRRKRDGIHELGLSGSAWERGFANAKLTPELLEQQERHLLRTAREFLPNAATFWLTKQLVAINNRNLPAHVTLNERLEVLGLTEGSVDHFPEQGVPLYHRVLNYHAAHDISHILIDNPLVTRNELIGCSAFAAWGDVTENGDLWVARNFDWEAGEIFDRDKCIIYVWPDDGIPFVHVAWAGMAGAVTGMNAAGISIHLNAARSDETRFGNIGTPVSMLVKRVLEHARSIDEAWAIVREADVFVSDSYLVASRDERRAVVIEKSPHHSHLREADQPGLILQTNHFLGEAWQDDALHREQLERATTLYRWQRLAELTEQHHGRINARACLEILRDRRGRGGKDIGLGNRNAIDAGICAHSVIMNVSTGELWVSSGPRTFGEYVYVPAAELLAGQSAGALRARIDRSRNLPRDQALDASNLAEFRRQLASAASNAHSGNKRNLEVDVRTLRNLNPNAFEAAYYAGRLAMLSGDFAQAERHFEEALDRDPHYEATREQIRVWLSRAQREAK